MPTSGSASTGALNQTSTYSLSCTGAAGSATASATVSVTSVPSSTGLKVSGNRLVDDNGNTIKLRGVQYTGAFEWGCSHSPGGDGARLTQTQVNELLSWHINAVRVGIAEDCWLGINGMPYGMTASQYQQHVKAWLDLLHQNHIYTEVSLMYAAPGTTLSTVQNPMPDEDHSPAFWTSIANYLKSEPMTFFGIYGEPHPPFSGENAWSCWRNGGSNCPSVTDGTTGAHYAAAGMQELVNDIRNTGASLPLSVGGINWATDLSAWLTNKPTDPQNQLVAEYHQYPGDEGCYVAGDISVANNSSCWNQTLAPITQQVPLFNGEAGEFAHSDTCSWTYLPTWLTWAEAHGVSYTLWKWGLGNGPCQNMALVTDQGSTPSPIYGQGYKSWLTQYAGK